MPFDTDLLRESFEAGQGITGAIQDDVAERIEEIEDDRLRRILGEPEHESLPEAMAADAVDVAPVVGDLLAGIRSDKAEQAEIDYPDRPVVVENAVSDLPEPLDSIGDVLISQNVMHHVGVEER